MENTSFLQRFVDLFFMPSRAFEGIVNGASAKDWFYPLVISSIAVFVLPFFFLDLSLDEADVNYSKAVQSIESRNDIPDEDRQDILARMAVMHEKSEDVREHPFAFRNLWQKIFIPISFVFMAAFLSGILLLVGNFGMGGHVKFVQIFTMVMMTYLIGGNGFLMNMISGVGTLELLVKTPLIVIRESTDMLFSPGLMFENVDSFLKQFLNHLDIFRIWGMVVMGFGFARLYNKPTATGIFAVGIPWLIMVSLGAALIQANARVIG